MSFLNPQGIPEFLLQDYSGSELTIEDDNDGEGAFDISITFDFRVVEYARRLPEQPGDGYQKVIYGKITDFVHSLAGSQ